MKMHVYEDDFHQAFIDANRENNFSVAGRRALFAYLEELEESIDEEIELNVVGLCLDFDEWEDLDEFARQHQGQWAELLEELRDDHGDDEDAIREAFFDSLNDYTRVIDVDGEAFITAAF